MMRRLKLMGLHNRPKLHCLGKEAEAGEAWFLGAVDIH
jgi:hypothetical protein